MRRLFGTDDAALSAAMKLEYTYGICHFFSGVSDNHIFIRDFMGMPYDADEADFAAYDVINARKGLVKTTMGKRIVEDLLEAIRIKCITHRLKSLYHEILDGRKASLTEIAALHEEYLAIIASVASKWDVYRKGLTPNKVQDAYERLKTTFAQQLDALRNLPFLKLRICVPDGYGVQHTRLSLRKNGQWKQIVDKVFKPNYVGTALSECFIPFPKELLGADAVRIESFGIGGEGVCWLEIPNGTPKSITAVHGIVEHPEHLLDNDVKFAWFGSQSSRDDYMDEKRSSTVHSVEISLV